MEKFNINNMKNYESKLENKNIKHVMDKFYELIADFLIYTIENVIVRNEDYYIFIIRRGLETLIHCFKTLLLYTKNFELVLFHCKKAYYYYVEFIGQIGDDSHSYLQLNSKDATLFVYKKTIFDINNEYRKNFTLDLEEEICFELISNLITLYYRNILCILNREKNVYEKRDAIIPFCTDKCKKVVNIVFDTDENFEVNNYRVLLCIHFTEEINRIVVKDSNTLMNIIITFIRKLKRKNLTKNKLNLKLKSPELSIFLNKNSSLKLVNWIFGN